MHPPAPAVRAIQVTPEPIVLDVGPVEVLIEASADDGTRLSGRLSAPDGSETALDFAAQPPPCDWRATHPFRPGDQAGTWRVTVYAGDTFAVHDFLVENRGTKPETRFADFDASPREVTRGEPVTFTGRLERSEGDDWVPAGDQVVVISFQEENTCGWRRFAEAVTDGRGAFRVRALARESGLWRGEFRGSDKLIGAQSVALFVVANAQARYETEIRGYDAGLSGAQTVHTGRLRGKPNTTWRWLGNKVISVFYRAPDAPANAFHSVNRSTVTVNTLWNRGRFTVHTGVRKGGAWRVEFAGDANARPDVSPDEPAPS